MSMPTGHTKSTATFEEDPVENLNRIIEMLAQLDDKKNKNNKHSTASERPEGDETE